MRTEEDEAFDDLAKKQGAWGGGFKAKQAMAADKLQEPWCMKMNDCKTKCEDCPDEPPQRTWVGLTEAERIDIIDEEITAQSIEHFALTQAIEAKLKELNT